MVPSCLSGSHFFLCTEGTLLYTYPHNTKESPISGRPVAVSRRIRTVAAVVTVISCVTVAAFAALDADVAIDYSGDGYDADSMVYGGNLHYQWNSVYQRDMSELESIAGHSWRVHWWDNTNDGYRWDTHTIEPDGAIYYWHKLDFEENSDGRYSAEEPNELAVEYWGPATDFAHSLAVTKTSSASQAYIAIRDIEHDLPIYLRFDLRIDGSVNFDAGGSWYVAYAGGESYSNAFRARLTDAREISVLYYGDGGSVEITSVPLSTDAWHSIEIKYGGDSGALWIDHTLVDDVPIDLTGKTLTGVFLGSVDSDAAGVEGRIYLDAVRVHDSYLGPNVLSPWNDDLTRTGRYLHYLTFDGNMMTVDDICRLAEQLNVAAVFQIPVSIEPAYGGQTGPPYAWDTIQYWADFVEYVNGTADPDYASTTFDWTHGTPADNWANLRAQRGRISPYNLEYIEIGNEPYYQEWNWDQPDSFAYFGQKWADMALAIKEVDPGIRCGLPGRQEWDLWDYAIPSILSRHPGEELIDWLAVHQYARILGQPDGDQLPWWMGAPVAKRWENRPDSLAGQPWLHYPQDAYAAADTYLSGQSNYASIFVGLTEYNYPINFPYGQYRNLVDAICKAGFIGGALEKNVKMAHVFTLDTEQRHTFGLIGDIDSSVVGRELTPSYYVYRLWGQYFGTRLVTSTVDGPTYLFDWSFGSNPAWETYRIPYLSVWASRNPGLDTLCIMAVNRHQTEEVEATIDIANFTPTGQADVYTVGGSGHTVWSSNESDPVAVTIEPSQIDTVSTSFAYSFEPLSVTAIVITGSAQVTFPVRVNFQPIDSGIPPDFLRDSGQPFGPLGVYEYGWE